jgi:hypothetical protein
MRTFSDVAEGHCFFLSKEGVDECYLRLRVEFVISGIPEGRELNAVNLKSARLEHVSPEEPVDFITNTEALPDAIRMLVRGRDLLRRIESIPHASGEFAVSGRSCR